MAAAKSGEPSGKSSKKKDVEPDEEFRVEDRRHWNAKDPDGADDGVEVRKPTIVDEYRRRAEDAETKLQEYIEAFKKHRDEQDQVRARLQNDVTRRVDLKFATMVGELLETVDTLDLSLEHVASVAEAEPLARGVKMARDRFLAILERQGIERIDPAGRAFDPNEAEAIRVDPVDDPALADSVTETLQPGFRLGDHVIRPARVAVGRQEART